MLRKVSSSTSPGKRTKKQPPYASLSQGPSPRERLARVLTQAKNYGIKPLTAEDLEAMGQAWPEDESLDEFLRWRRQSRTEDRK